jgi:threonine dehydratase
MKSRIVTYFPHLQNINRAKITIKEVALHTPLQQNQGLSEEFNANILLKREDLQIVRSYKIRGAFNKIAQLSNRGPAKRCCLRQRREPCPGSGLFVQ